MVLMEQVCTVKIASAGNQEFDARTYNYANQMMILDEKIELKVDEQCDFQRNIDILNEFDKRNRSDIIKAIIKSKIKKMIFQFQSK